MPRNQFLHHSRVVPKRSDCGWIRYSRSSVVEAYFDGTERDSVLGTYSITEEGETTLDAPLAAYRVEDGEVLPAR